MTTWCLIPNLVLYFAASLFYLLFPFEIKRKFQLAKVALVLVWFGISLHAIYIAYLSLQNQFYPLSIVSFGVMLLFVGLVWRTRSPGLGTFFVPLGLILFLISLRSHPDPLFFQKGGWLTFHVLTATLALLLMLGNFILGGIFLIQEWELKTKRSEIWGWPLPPLRVGEQTALTMLQLGFFFLTLVLISGAVPMSRGALPPLGWFHIALALLAWLLYALVLNRRWLAVQGKRILLLSTLGFVSLSFAYLWTSLF